MAYFPCSNHPENLRNGKISIFWFETMFRFFFSFKKKYFFGSKKMSLEIFWNVPKSENCQWKINIFSTTIFDFPLKIFWFWNISKFSSDIFFRAKKIFFLGVEIKIWTKLWNRKSRSFDCARFQSDPSNSAGRCNGNVQKRSILALIKVYTIRSSIILYPLLSSKSMASSTIDGVVIHNATMLPIRDFHCCRHRRQEA